MFGIASWCDWGLLKREKDFSSFLLPFQDSQSQLSDLSQSRLVVMHFPPFYQRTSLFSGQRKKSLV